MAAMIESAVIRAELAYWESRLCRDAEAATRLIGADTMMVGAQGVTTLQRDRIGAAVTTDGWQLTRYELSDITVREVTSDVVVIAYHVTEELGLEDERMCIEANDTTVWKRENGGWISVVHTESLIGDPYARDRRGPLSS
jgi:hypothetical protein